MSFFTGRRQTEPEEVQRTDTTSTQPTQPRISPTQPIGFETVLGANSTLEGSLTSHANVRLDGTFTGTLEISGNVLIGETAKINADVNAKNISIAGAVRGNVNGKKVQILRTGRVWGDITATALTTEEGAFIDGKISMISHEAARQAEAESRAGDQDAYASEVKVIDAQQDISVEEPDFLKGEDKVSALADDDIIDVDPEDIEEDDTRD